MTEDQKIQVEPWIAVFGKDTILKLFSKKFSDKEKAIQECEDVLKSKTCTKSKETLKVACLVVNKTIQDKVMAVTVKGISLLETTLCEHADEQFDGSASLVMRILFSNLFARIGD